MKNVILIISTLLLLIGCKTQKSVLNSETYYLLKKNNGLQTIVPLINPYVYVSKDKQEILRIKEELELKYLKSFPIDFHYDHREVVCDEEMIEFDKFLIEEYDFSFLADGFDHSKKELNGQIQYGKQFPKSFSNQDLITIQNRMGKYHFELVEQSANGKSIIVLNPWDISNDIRDSEFYQLELFYNSKIEAKEFIEQLVEGQFDSKMSYMTVGTIKDEDITSSTKNILNNQSEIKYKSNREDYGGIFFSNKKLAEIDDGMNTLMKIYESVGKTPYQIVELK